MKRSDLPLFLQLESSQSSRAAVTSVGSLLDDLEVWGPHGRPVSTRCKPGSATELPSISAVSIRNNGRLISFVSP